MHNPPSHVHILVSLLQTKYHFGSLCNCLANLTNSNSLKESQMVLTAFSELRLFQRPLLE